MILICDLSLLSAASCSFEILVIQEIVYYHPSAIKFYASYGNVTLQLV